MPRNQKRTLLTHILWSTYARKESGVWGRYRAHLSNHNCESNLNNLLSIVLTYPGKMSINDFILFTWKFSGQQQGNRLNIQTHFLAECISILGFKCWVGVDDTQNRHRSKGKSKTFANNCVCSGTFVNWAPFECIVKKTHIARLRASTKSSCDAVSASSSNSLPRPLHNQHFLRCALRIPKTWGEVCEAEIAPR